MDSKSKIRLGYVCLLQYLLLQFSTVINLQPNFFVLLKRLNLLCWAKTYGERCQLVHCKLND